MLHGEREERAQGWGNGGGVIAAEEGWEEAIADSSLDRCEVFGYAVDDALEMLPFLLVALLQPDEGALGGGAGDLGRG